MTKRKAANTNAIEWTPDDVTLGSLEPWERNPRHSTKAQAKRMLKSVDDLGQFQTIAIGPEVNGKSPVYDGHQRLSALLNANGPAFVVHVLRSSRPLTDDERKRLVLAAHAGATGSWDWDALAGWDGTELIAGGLDAEYLAMLNADAAALATMLEADAPAPVEDVEPQIDRAEELRVKWGVESGQMWQLGEHRIICGDCTDRAVVERVMGGERADCTVTDPPYGVGVDYVSFSDTPENVKSLVMRFMPIALEYSPVALTPGVPAMWDYPRPTWVGSWVHPASSSSGPWGFVGSNPILYYGKDPYLASGKGRRDSSLVAASDRKGEDDHPVSKPLNVWEWLIERMTPGGNEIVYEPFSGSGTTLIACERLGRKCRAIEIDPGYIAVALERWSTATGKTPVLVDPIGG